MKKFLIVVVFLLSLSMVDVNAQAFEAKDCHIDFGFGVGSHKGIAAIFSPGVLVSFEKGVHKWIGIGAYVGYQYTISGHRHSIPFGGTGSFHFYQMISDLTGADIAADKLDLAFKLALGAKTDIPGSSSLFSFDYGCSLTARYFLTEKFGIYAEVGYPAMGFLVVGGALKF